MAKSLKWHAQTDFTGCQGKGGDSFSRIIYYFVWRSTNNVTFIVVQFSRFFILAVELSVIIFASNLLFNIYSVYFFFRHLLFNFYAVYFSVIALLNFLIRVSVFRIKDYKLLVHRDFMFGINQEKLSYLQIFHSFCRRIEKGRRLPEK